MTSPKWLDPVENRVWRSFLASMSGVISTLDAQLKAEAGIALDDYEVLIHLSEAPEHRLRMNDLSKLLLHSKSRLTQRIDRLETRGWVTREKAVEDGRGTWAVLSSDGLKAIVEAAPKHLGHVRANFMDCIESDEIEAVAAALERIADRARQEK